MSEDQVLLCSRCKVPKLSSDFYADSRYKAGFRGVCKECCQASNRKWKRDHPVLRAPRKYSKRRYGLPPSWYASKFEEQDGKCAICGSAKSGITGRRLSIDHCHTTETVRGLLCNPCNHALERLETVDGWADKAIAYLQHYATEKRSTSVGS